MEITECLQNCSFTEQLSQSTQANFKKKLIEKLSKSKDFTTHDLR